MPDRFRRVLVMALAVGALALVVWCVVRPSGDRQSSLSATNSSLGAPGFRFESPEDIQGLEVYADGVFLGRTPFEISEAELEAKVDASKQTSNEPRRVNPSPHIQRTRFHSAREPVVLRTVDRLNTEFRNYYLEVKFEDRVGLFDRTERSPVAKSRYDLIFLLPRFEQWRLEIGKLLDVARLQNYRPVADWYAAFNSYGDRSWRRLLLESRDEPAFVELGKLIACHQYSITGSETPKEAWRKVQLIADDAVQSRSWELASQRGWALAQLATRVKLSPCCRC